MAKPREGQAAIADRRRGAHLVDLRLRRRPADEPFSDWRGVGCARDGGSAIVNYDTIPGEIRPDLGLEEGFNSEYFLKATIHELGHALGLSHLGPDLSLGLGNSLMGPNVSRLCRAEAPERRPGVPERGLGRDALEAPGLLRNAQGPPATAEREAGRLQGDVQPGVEPDHPRRASSSPTCPRTASSSSTTWASPTNTGMSDMSPGSPRTAPSA